MTTPPQINTAFGSWSDFFSQADPAAFPHAWLVRGFVTREDCDRWFHGEPVLFDEVREWLDEYVTGHALVYRDDFSAQLGVALDSDWDAVAFKLRWNDVLGHS